MANNPAYDPTDPRYYDEKDLRAEVERVFSVCADCRMCVKYCGSFPKLFDAVDDHCAEGKYADVNTKKLKSEDVDKMVDDCFQCKLCYIKCPYTPGDHEWAIDFPRLMTRAKAQACKEQWRAVGRQAAGQSGFGRKIGNGDGTASELGKQQSAQPQADGKRVGIHKDKMLPPFARTFAAQFAAKRQAPQGEPAAKIAFFSTCYVNYNQPEIGNDTLEVMAHNNIDVAFAYESCCGMPRWHNGDMDGAIEAAKQNVASLSNMSNEGRMSRPIPPVHR